MSHNHLVEDTDKRFVINPDTKTVSTTRSNIPVLAQYDHNSEYITFEIQRFVENHDLSKCDKVEIHYNNVEEVTEKRAKHVSKGLYDVKDLRIDPGDNQKVVFTWIISEKATTWKGTLEFVVSFVCLTDDDVDYRFNTVTNTDLLKVGSGINNTDEIEERYADVLETWKADLFGIGDMYKTEAKNGYLTASADVLNNGTMLSIEDVCHVCKNNFIVFYGLFDAFSGVRIGRGKTVYGGAYVEIDNTNVKVYSYTTEAKLESTHVHGLTFSNLLTVVIKAKVTTADITLFTSSGSYTIKDAAWIGSNGLFFAESVGTSFTDCELRWTTFDLKQDIWVFGDSYLGMNDARWSGQMLNLGYSNWLASGFPGGGSINEIESFKTLLKLRTPEMVVWCVGMNDGDNGSINSNWLACVNEMLNICKDNKIVPVLATIPTCPAVTNTYKNDWVRNRGRRYVDFDKAVRVSGTSWYEGMLSGDNIHPTELGAKALAMRVCVDVPEIME